MPSHNLSVHWPLHLSCRVHYLIIEFLGPLLILYTYPGELIHFPGSTLPFIWWWIQIFGQFKSLSHGWDWYIQCLLDISIWMSLRQLILNLSKINLIAPLLKSAAIPMYPSQIRAHHLPACMSHWVSNSQPWLFPHLLCQWGFWAAGQGNQLWLIWVGRILVKRLSVSHRFYSKIGKQQCILAATEPESINPVND